MLSNATNQPKATVELSYLAAPATLWSISDDTHKEVEI